MHYKIWVVLKNDIHPHFIGICSTLSSANIRCGAFGQY